jgi:hypothetical protein
VSKTVKSQTVNQWFDSFLLVAGGKSLIMVNRPDMISGYEQNLPFLQLLVIIN